MTTAADGCPNALRAPCPDCGRKTALPFMRAAQIVVRRACSKCRQAWQIKATPAPLQLGDAIAHVLNWLRI